MTMSTRHPDTRTFSVKLPTRLRRRADPLERGLDFRGFWRSFGKSPHALVRAVITSQYEEEGGDPTESEPGSVVWCVLTTGFPAAVPVDQSMLQRALHDCDRCEESADRIGVVPTGDDAQVELSCCPCGRGVGVWRHGPAIEGPFLVLSLRPGPSWDDVRAAIVVPPAPRDPVPPTSFLIRDGRIRGQLSFLPNELVFTNDLGIEVEGRSSGPVVLDAGELEHLHAFARRTGPQLVRTMAGIRGRLERERTIWSISGVSPPDGDPGGSSDASDAAESDVEETTEAPDGRSANRPLPARGPAAAPRMIAELRCDHGRRWHVEARGFERGTCPDPRGHDRTVNPLERPDEEGGVAVERFELKCGCGNHELTLFFDHFHPAAALPG